jgi:hypothetical protein
MKKPLILLAFLFTALIYSQESTPLSYSATIDFEPAEVSSSAVVTMDFADPKEVKYTVVKNNETILTKEITKNEGTQALKIDLSFLEKGTYEIHIFIDDNEVKNQTFKKL